MTFVYFVEAEGSDAIKIGVATDVRRRIASLQTANSHRLSLLHSLPGTHLTESRLHRRLRTERISGEWFRADAVRAFIERLVALAPEAQRDLCEEKVADPIDEEEIARGIEAAELLTGACLAVIREIGVERAAAELTKRWGPEGRAVSPGTLRGVLEGRFSLRVEWLHWFARRSDDVADILERSVDEMWANDDGDLGALARMRNAIREELGPAAVPLLRRARNR